jgi:plastocyanin
VNAAPVLAVNAFHVLGALFAAWAVVVAVLGIRRHDFPGLGGRERGVAAISIFLAFATICAAIVTAALEDEEEAEGGQEAAEPAAGGGERIELGADPGGAFKFDRNALEAKAGPATLVMENPSSIPHNVSLEGGGVEEEGETVEQGGTSTVSAELRPGRYTFYCSVPGHREGGMEGTLSVE